MFFGGVPNSYVAYMLLGATLPKCDWVLHCLYVIGCYVAYMLLGATLPICYWVLRCLYVIGCYVAYMLLGGSIKNRGCSEPLL